MKVACHKIRQLKQRHRFAAHNQIDVTSILLINPNGGTKKGGLGVKWDACIDLAHTGKLWTRLSRGNDMWTTMPFPHRHD